MELGHWLIDKRGPEVVRHGRLLSESPAFRVDHEIGASGKRPTIANGNGAVAKAPFDELKNHVQRVTLTWRVNVRIGCSPRSVLYPA